MANRFLVVAARERAGTVFGTGRRTVEIEYDNSMVSR